MHTFVSAALALLVAVATLPAADPPKVEQTEAGKKALDKVRQLGGLALEVAQNILSHGH